MGQLLQFSSYMNFKVFYLSKQEIFLSLIQILEFPFLPELLL